MNRQEFIAELRRAMSGSFSAAEIEDAATYYEEYITMQMKKGKREEEVLGKLGSPRLITKSMKAAGEGAGGRTGARGNVGRNAGTYRDTSGNAGAQGNAGGNAGAWRRENGSAKSTAHGGNAASDEEHGYNGRTHTFHVPMWLVLMIVLLVLIIVLAIVFRLIIILLPIALLVVGVITICRYFSKI